VPRARIIKSLFFIAFLLASLRTPAQTFSLRQLTQHAGIVFAGTVTHIQPDAQQVHITFRVDQGIRGVPSKRTFTIREWAGLWAFSPRYRVGEHLVLLLYPPSSTGLTSPVGGAIGRFSIDDRNRIIIPTDWAYRGGIVSPPVPRSRPPNKKGVPHPSFAEESPTKQIEGVPHPSASAEGAPLRLTVKQFTRLVRKAAK
jgi:hypothetical protein